MTDLISWRVRWTDDRGRPDMVYGRSEAHARDLASRRNGIVERVVTPSRDVSPIQMRGF